MTIEHAIDTKYFQEIFSVADASDKRDCQNFIIVSFGILVVAQKELITKKKEGIMTSIVKRENAIQPATFGSVVDQIFQNNLSRYFDDDFWGSNVSANRSHVPVNIRETDKTVEMDLIAPGLKKQDFQLNVNGDMLTVSFEHKEDKKQENKNEGWLRQEYKQQTFSRSFHLDDTVDAGKIVARYEDGVLHLSLPKKENAQRISRNINVQ